MSTVEITNAEYEQLLLEASWRPEAAPGWLVASSAFAPEGEATPEAREPVGVAAMERLLFGR